METLQKKRNQIAEFCKSQGIAFAQSEPLSLHSTFRIGGPALLFVEPKTTEEIQALVQKINAVQIPMLTLGRGSNILFSDQGYGGVVLHLGEGFSRMELLDDTTIFCESGALLLDLCLFALSHGLSGMETLYGIPGSVGGAIYMNAGAYGGEVKDVLTKAAHITTKGAAGEYRGDDLALGYRHSAYCDTDEIITGGVFSLSKGDPEEIKATMDELMGRRRDRQPLEYPSAGSTFKRPPGHYASALIDECGLKGFRVGGAEVSQKHAGFVINIEEATSQDVLGVIRGVRERVKREKGVELELEMHLIGFASPSLEELLKDLPVEKK